MQRRPAGTLVIALALTGMSGCVSLPPAQQGDSGSCEGSSPGPDSDGDGYASCGVLRPDCDDDAPAVHPGAREICDDGIDQDCAGDVELACSVELAGNSTTGVDVWTVSNEALAITFDRGSAADGLTGVIGLQSRAGSGAQLLATDTRSQDRYAGVTRWPSVFSWRSASAAPLFTELVTGEAAVQVRSTWVEAGGNGTSLFTIYPDGRVHRHDELSVLASSDQYLATYVTFDPARVDEADWDGAIAPVPLDIDSGTTYEEHYAGTSAGYICVHDTTTGDRVLFGAQPQAGSDGTRVSEANRSGALVAALSFDWQRGATVLAGDYEGDTMWHVGNGPGPRPCLGAVAFVTAFRQPPAIAVAAPGSVVAGDSDGYRERSGSYEVSAGGAADLSITLAAAVPSLALHVIELRNLHDPVVLRDGDRLVRGRDYHVQQGTDDLWLVVTGGVSTGGVRVEWP